MVKALRRWQEKLGAQQDADVAGRRLRALAMQPPKGLPSETLFLMGQLAAHYQDRAWKARKRHPRAYRKVQERWKALKSEAHNRTTRDPRAAPRHDAMDLLIVQTRDRVRPRSQSLARRRRAAFVTGRDAPRTQSRRRPEKIYPAPGPPAEQPVGRARQTAQILTEVAGWPAAEETRAVTGRAGARRPGAARPGSQQADSRCRPPT